MITPVILAGGNGTRLWPLSRTLYPKQFLSLISDYTLLQGTAMRCINPRFNPLTVICNNEHRFLVAEQLKTLNILPENIILENVARNTGPAILIACLMQADPETLILVLPADHKLEDHNLEEFYLAIDLAKNCALQGKIVTFGIIPYTAEVNYGYIKKGQIYDLEHNIYNLAKFIEKPDHATAQKFLADPESAYYWNSGIFLFRAKVMLAEIARLHPELLEHCKRAVKLAQKDLDFLRVDLSNIPSSKFNSIDHLVMEKTQTAVVLPVNLGWSDLGSWNALWDMSPKDQDGNVLIGNVITNKTYNSYIRTEHQLVTTLGLDDLIVVATNDAIFISAKQKLVDLPELLQKLQAKECKELDQHLKVYRPWGYYQVIDHAARFQVKRIFIKPGAKTSTQIHYHRAEHWVVVQGTAKVIKGDQELLLQENESIYLPLGIKHRLENPGKIPLHLIEVQSGAYLGEDDILRLEDKYGR